MIDTIINNFDIWTTAQTRKSKGRVISVDNQSGHGINKLRELILELAIRGKLVPQDPTDEPISVLLRRILAEKERLIKEGKIKKQKLLLEISEEEKLFELPNVWKWAKLQTLVFLLGDGLHGTPIYTTETKYYFINGNNLNNGKIEIKPGTKTVSKEEMLKYKKELSSNTIMVSINGTLGNVAFYNGEEIMLGKSVCYFNLSGNIFKYYIKMVLESQYFMNYALRNATGTTIKNLGLKAMNDFPIPLPNLAEQHRIVAKVGELMILCDQFEQQQSDSNTAHQLLVKTLLCSLTNASDHDELVNALKRIVIHFDTLFTTEDSIDQLKQTILQLAIMGKLVPQNPDDEPTSELLKKIAEEKARLVKEGRIKPQKPLLEIGEDEKLFELPDGWKWRRLGECFFIMSGTSFDKSKELENGQYLYVKVADTNLEGNEVEITTSSRFFNPTKKELNALIPAGSIIFPKRGGAIATNKKRLVKNDLFVDLNIMAITPIKGITLDYAYRWLMGIDLAKLNTGTSVPQINHKDIAPLLFPIPPLAEQHRIVAKVDELFSICDALKERINDSQTTQVQLADAIVEKAVT